MEPTQGEEEKKSGTAVLISIFHCIICLSEVRASTTAHVRQSPIAAGNLEALSPSLRSFRAFETVMFPVAQFSHRKQASMP